MISRPTLASLRATTDDESASRAARRQPGAEGQASGDDSGDRRDATTSAIVIARVLAAHSRRRGGGAGGRGGSGGSTPTGLLDDDELREVEATYAEGISAVQVVDLFVSRGVKFSEATFRKYVQQGLLPRSRRIGRKGKHRGSMGVYPARTVRRINAIKQLMAEGHTIEEIQEQFLRFSDLIESIEEGLGDLFGQLDAELERPQYDNRARKTLERQISEARDTADELMRRLGDITRRVTAPKADQARTTGAAGSAEDLL